MGSVHFVWAKGVPLVGAVLHVGNMNLFFFFNLGSVQASAALLMQHERQRQRHMIEVPI